MNPDSLVLKYDFSHVNSTIAADCSHNGQAGVIRNYDCGGARVVTLGGASSQNRILHLTGGDKGGYLQIPDGALLNSSSLTVSFCFCCNECSERASLISFGAYKVLSVLLSPLSGSEFYLQACATSNGLSQAALSEPVTLRPGQWYLLTLTFDTESNGNRLSIYINGVLKTSFTQKRLVCSSPELSEDCFIGHGPFSFVSSAADIGTFSIWHEVLSEDDIAAQYKEALTEEYPLSDSEGSGSATADSASFVNASDANGKIAENNVQNSSKPLKEPLGQGGPAARELCSEAVFTAQKSDENPCISRAVSRRGRHAGLQNVMLRGNNFLTRNRDGCLEYLKLLDADRMLYSFRLTFGEDTKGARPLGGWDEPMGLLRGHSTGHYLSALALSYASTGDKEIKEKLEYIVNELSRLQKLSQGNARDFRTACTPSNASQKLWSKDCSTWGRGYLGAYPPDQFALLEQFTPYATIWAPYYTMHKILAGLIDCYTYAASQTALECACLLGDWVSDRLAATTHEQRSKMWSMYIAGEYGGMNESLSALYVITKKPEYLETAAMFDNPKVFDGLSVNLDTISGIHANQHIPQIIGALKRYEAEGDIKYYNIAAVFWNIVTRHYAYSMAGVGRGEVFKEPDILAGNIDQDRNCETCATYNMLKLTKELYTYDPENPRYMDYFERGLINHIAASRNPLVSENMHNGVTYMLPIGPGVRREYSSDYDDFTCCHGTGMENHVKYQDCIFFIDESNRKLYVNLYLDSELSVPGSLSLKVNDREQTAVITLGSDIDYSLRFRVPGWATGGMQIELNNEVICKTDRPSGYLEPEHIYRKGDVLTIRFPYEIRLEATPDMVDNETIACVCYGPYVMSALNGYNDWITLDITQDLRKCFTVSYDADAGYPVLDMDGLRFVPMYVAHNTSYHTYFKIRRL